MVDEGYWVESGRTRVFEVGLVSEYRVVFCSKYHYCRGCSRRTNNARTTEEGDAGMQARGEGDVERRCLELGESSRAWKANADVQGMGHEHGMAQAKLLEIKPCFGRPP